MAKKTNDKSRKPDNTEKIPLPYDSDKIGKDVSKDRVWTSLTCSSLRIRKLG